MAIGWQSSLMRFPCICSVFLLAISLAQAAENPIPTSSTPIKTLPGSYCAFVRQGDALYFFSEQVTEGTVNTTNKICPGISLYQIADGDLTKSTFVKTVAPNDLINDVFSQPGELDPKRLLTRLGVVFSPKDQKFHAIAYVSRGYPSADGTVVPAIFRSKTADPLGEWEYLGKITLNEAPVGFFGSGNNLLLNDNHGAEVNHQDPFQNKFVHYIDQGMTLMLIYSNDGTQWFTHKDAEGKVANLRPAALRTEKPWIFASVVRTKSDGFFMSATVNWPPEGHHFLHSNDGMKWTAIGDGTMNSNVGGLPKAKNVTLGYDEKTDLIHLLITRTGSEHFKHLATMKPKDLAAGVEKKVGAEGTP